jgi:predicted small secreted protein
MRQKSVTVCVLSASLFLTSCGTTRRVGDSSSEGDSRGAQVELTAGLSEALQRRTQRDLVIEGALQDLSKKLSGGAPTRVRLVAPDLQAPEPIYVSTREEWYFNTQALRGLKFENELAVAMALSPSLPSSGDVRNLNWITVARAAVSSLYRAGYDPRGAVTFWREWGRVMRNSGTMHQSAISWGSRALELEEETRLEIAKLPPLLNPVVRSPEFAKIGKRLQKL